MRRDERRRSPSCSCRRGARRLASVSRRRRRGCRSKTPSSARLPGIRTSRARRRRRRRFSRRCARSGRRTGRQSSATSPARRRPDGTRITAGALNNPSIFDRFATGVIASQLVTDFGRTSDLVQTQKLRAGAQEQDVTLVRAEVLLDVDRAYFDVLRAQAVERVAMQTVDARQLVVDQVTALASSGLRSGLDLSFARVNLSQAQVLLVQAQGDVQSAFAALNTAMGAPQTSTYELVDEPLVAPSADDVSVVIAQALRDRPDVAAERLSAQAACEIRGRRARAAASRRRPPSATAGVTPYRDSALERTLFGRRLQRHRAGLQRRPVFGAPRRGHVSGAGRRRGAARSGESCGARRHARVGPAQDGVSARRPDEPAGGAGVAMRSIWRSSGTRWGSARSSS